MADMRLWDELEKEFTKSPEVQAIILKYMGKPITEENIRALVDELAETFKNYKRNWITDTSRSMARTMENPKD